MREGKRRCAPFSLQISESQIIGMLEKIGELEGKGASKKVVVRAGPRGRRQGRKARARN